jgi:hypothetical protein
MAFLRWILNVLQLDFWRTLDGVMPGGEGATVPVAWAAKNLQISPEYRNLCSERGGEAGHSIEKVHFFHF